jgi:hypothetical protein
VDLTVEETMEREHPDLKWKMLTGNIEGKQNYLNLSADVRRLITGQGKKPHEYAMLGHHWAIGADDKVHRTCHRLEEFRKPGHPVSGIHMAVLPKTAAENRAAHVSTLMGRGGDHRLYTQAQKDAYERRTGREYNDWPLSTSKVPGQPSVPDRAKSEAQLAAYKKANDGFEWEMYKTRVGLDRRPSLYAQPREVKQN